MMEAQQQVHVVRDFCVHCGARVPPISGETTCPECHPWHTAQNCHLVSHGIACFECDYPESEARFLNVEEYQRFIIYGEHIT